MKEGVLQIINSKSKTLSVFCFLFIAGSGAASMLDIKFSKLMYLGVFILISIVVLLWENKILRFAFLSILIVYTSFFRFSQTIPDCKDKNFLCFYNEKEVVFTGIIVSEPEIKIDKNLYTIGKIQVNNIYKKGRVSLSAQPYPLYKFGDRLRISCKLEKPKINNGFRFDKYMASKGVWSTCNFSVVNKIGENQGNVFLSYIYKTKSVVDERLHQIWNEPEASLMAGLLYGGKSGLPKFINEYFSKTGTSHIMAISGFNITIIIFVLMNLVINLGLFRRQAFFIMIFCISIFLIFSGLSSSAVRAGVMGLLILTAQYFGRGNRLFNLIVCSAALMQLYNPYLLLWDVGFQLSFLALIGIVYLSPALSQFLFIRSIQNHEVVKNFYENFIISTLSTIIMTFPLILYQFGTFSVVAPLTNFLVLWTIPLIMLLGASTLALGFVSITVAKIFGYLAHFGLSYVIMIVEFFGKRSWSSLNYNLPFSFMILIYFSIFYLIKEKVYVKRKS